MVAAHPHHRYSFREYLHVEEMSTLKHEFLSTGLATYPDASVICGEPQRDPESSTHVTNPSARRRRALHRGGAPRLEQPRSSV